MEIHEMAQYLAHDCYVFLITATLCEDNEFVKCRTIYTAHSYTDAMILAEAEFGDALEEIKIEILDTCLTFDEETFEKFRKDKMPIYSEE